MLYKMEKMTLKELREWKTITKSMLDRMSFKPCRNYLERVMDLRLELGYLEREIKKREAV